MEKKYFRAYKSVTPHMEKHKISFDEISYSESDIQTLIELVKSLCNIRNADAPSTNSVGVYDYNTALVDTMRACRYMQMDVIFSDVEFKLNLKVLFLATSFILTNDFKSFYRLAKKIQKQFLNCTTKELVLGSGSSDHIKCAFRSRTAEAACLGLYLKGPLYKTSSKILSAKKVKRRGVSTPRVLTVKKGK